MKAIMKKIVFTIMIALVLPLVAAAQNATDDLYYTPSRVKAVAVNADNGLDVDAYNHRQTSSNRTTAYVDIDEDSYEYSTRIVRFHSPMIYISIGNVWWDYQWRLYSWNYPWNLYSWNYPWNLYSWNLYSWHYPWYYSWNYPWNYTWHYWNYPWNYTWHLYSWYHPWRWNYSLGYAWHSFPYVRPSYVNGNRRVGISGRTIRTSTVARDANGRTGGRVSNAGASSRTSRRVDVGTTGSSTGVNRTYSTSSSRMDSRMGSRSSTGTRGTTSTTTRSYGGTSTRSYSSGSLGGGAVRSGGASTRSSGSGGVSSGGSGARRR